MEGLKIKYFVLNPVSSDPVHSEASRVAMEAYAEHMKYINPKLSADVYKAAADARVAEHDNRERMLQSAGFCK